MEIPRLDYTLAVQEASELRDLLSKHGFVVLTALPPTTLTTLGDAMVAGQRFFSLPQTMKDKLVVPPPSQSMCLTLFAGKLCDRYGYVAQRVWICRRTTDKIGQGAVVSGETSH